MIDTLFTRPVIRIHSEQLKVTRKRGDLAGYAAAAALAELNANWAAAVADGYDPRELLKDIDEVRARLEEHRERVELQLSQLPTPPCGYCAPSGHKG